MSHPSFKTDAEIRLLTKMLTDNFHEEDPLFPGEPLRTSECPAPALLYALFEPSAKDSGVDRANARACGKLLGVSLAYKASEEVRGCFGGSCKYLCQR